MSTFAEFPKALFKDGWADLDACVVVRSEAEEVLAREQGYRPLSEPVDPITPQPEKRKPGRPKKVE